MDTILYFQSPTKTSAPDKIAGVRRHAAVADWHVQAVDGIPTSNALEGLVSFWHPLGIILDCGGGYQEIPTDLFAGLPTVYLDRNPRTMPADTSCVSHDSVATGQLAAKELLVAGHPNFAFVPYPQPRFWSDDRERGFRDALALNGLTCETFDGGGRGTLQTDDRGRGEHGRERRDACPQTTPEHHIPAGIGGVAVPSRHGENRQVDLSRHDSLTPRHA